MIDEKTEVSATVLGLAIGVTRKRVEQLAADGVIARLGKGRFPLLAGVAGYIEWLKSDQRNASKSAAASRINDARAAEIEQRTSERKKRLKIEASEHALAVIDEFGGPLKADLMSMPARWTADIALRRRIEDDVDAAFGAAGKRALAEANKDGVARREQPAPAARRRRS